MRRVAISIWQANGGLCGIGAQVAWIPESDWHFEKEEYDAYQEELQAEIEDDDDDETDEEDFYEEEA